jgi:hypothetical protein
MLARLSGLGATAGMVALLLWPFYRGWQEGLHWPFSAAAAVAGLCGTAILLLTLADLLFHRPRGQRLRPVRAFDIVLGVGLVLLSLVALGDVAGQLPG